MPPFLLKEKVAPKVQADFDAGQSSIELFFFQNRHLLKELSRTLSVEQPAGRR